MKLATYKDGSRDGQLVVVSRDLSAAHYATGIAHTLQQVMDDWNFLAPQLQDLAHTLNLGKARHAFPFEPQRCMAPLPRACRWAVGAAYLAREDLAHRARGSQPPADGRTAPRLWHAASDELLGPCDPLRVASEDFGIDLGAGLAVVTGDLPQGTGADEAIEGVRLLMLANDFSLQHLRAPEGSDGSDATIARPATAFSPVAVSMDELGEAWQGGRLHLGLQVSVNGRKLGLCDTGAEMGFHFGQLLAQLCRTRKVRAGSIVGSGVVAQAPVEREGQPHWPKGHASLTDKRAMETVLDGQPATGFLKFGDSVRIEVKDAQGQSLCGAIEQAIEALA